MRFCVCVCVCVCQIPCRYRQVVSGCKRLAVRTPDPWLGRVKAKQIKRLRVFESTLDTRSEPNHPIAMACPTASSAA